VHLEETGHVLDCPFCRVKHLVVCKPLPTCLIPPRDPAEPNSLYYLPYWRFKGMAFGSRDCETAHRLIDTTAVALQEMSLPYSLGFRTQTQSMHFLTHGAKGHFLVPEIPRKQIVGRISSKFLGMSPLDHTCQFQVQVGEVLSLIYAPLIIQNNAIVNGISGKRLSGIQAASLMNRKARSAGDTIQFVPALCPHCGFGLSGEQDSLVQRCDNCHNLWYMKKESFARIKAKFFGNASEESLYLPFWRFYVTTRALKSKHFPDLIRQTQLIRSAGKASQETSLLLHIPAFSIRPDLFLRLARQTSCHMPERAELSRFPRGTYHPVTISAGQGFQAIAPLLSDMSKDKQRFAELIGRERLTPKGVALSYIAFEPGRMEVVQREMGCAVQRSALRFGRLISEQ